MDRRAYQHEALAHFIGSVERLWALLWERQAGKSTTFADMALYEMLKFKNRTIVYGSASLLLAQEITLKASIRANQTASDIIQGDARVLKRFADNAAASQDKDHEFHTVDARDEKRVGGLKEADFTELFSQGRLEFRIYHDRTTYSRTKVIAPNIATARSWSGTVLLDEIAFIHGLRELITALLPIISTNPDYKLILSTTPPEFDDTHFSFELLAPPAGLEFKPKAEGNWYTSESQISVHRADAFDTNLAGKKIYDLKTGETITPAQAYEKAPNKDGHKIAHWLAFMIGGAAACDLLRLKTAQERGGERGCQNFQISSDADMVAAVNWLAKKLEALMQGTQTGARVKVPFALGFDVATTTKGVSNPSVLSLAMEEGPEVTVLARFVWKTKDPDVANERLDQVIDTCIAAGCRPRALAQDATNEKYYAEDNRKRLRRKLPVILVVASESVERPGLEKPTNWKEWLGDRLVAKLDDNNLTLPGDQYTRIDYRLVMKDRGKYVCEPNAQGMHGDTFDGDKLALHALGGSSSRTVMPDYAKIDEATNPLKRKWPPFSCEPPPMIAADTNTL